MRPCPNRLLNKLPHLRGVPPDKALQAAHSVGRHLGPTRSANHRYALAHGA